MIRLCDVTCRDCKGSGRRLEWVDDEGSSGPADVEAPVDGATLLGLPAFQHESPYVTIDVWPHMVTNLT